MNRRFPIKLMATLCAATCAFMTSFAAAQVTVSSIISYPGGSSIATTTEAAYVDVYGNIFVIDTNGSRVAEIPANGGPLSVVATGLTNSRGVAADSLGNVYIGQLNNTYVGKYPVGGGAIVTLPTSGTTIAGRQFMLALDSANPANLYVTDQNGSRVEKINTSTGVSITDFADTEGMKGAAFDPAGDLFVTNGTNSTLTELPAGSSTAVTVTLTGLNTPYGIAFDKAGDLYIMNEGTSNLLEYPVGFTATTTPTTVITTSSGATSVMLNPRGDLIYSNGAHIYALENGAGNFYGVPVGSTSTASLVSITYTFTAATTLGAVPAVYTSNNSATPLFAGSTLSGAPTTPLCTASKAYAANATCILNVAFLPTQVGVATGSVSLISSTGAVLATTPLMGVGDGPAAGFSPGTQSTLLSSLGQPEGVAIDAGGNTYVADLVSEKVTKTTSGGTTAALAFTSLAQPTGVAVDGMGSVYVSDAHNNAVYKLTSGGTQSTLATTGLSSPAGIAVDGFNNVYIADSGNARIVKVTAAGVQSVVGFTGLTSPMWVAVDFGGDIFVSDSGKIYEYSALGVQTTVPTSGLGSPAGIAAAANGSLYIADTTNKDVYVLPYTGISGIPTYGTAFTLASGFTTPTGLALSGAGVLTIADSGTKSVFVLDQTKQTLTFPSTATGATSAEMTAKLEDVGNSSITLSNLVVSSNYAQVTPVAGDCTTTSTVTAASSCNVNILFEPQPPVGSDPGTVTLTDNALNATSATQVINLVGTGITPTTTTVSSSNTSPVYGTPFNIIATVAPTTGSGTVANGDTVTFTVDGGTPVNETTTGGVATYPTPAGFAAGQHTVVATFNGDSNYAASTSTTFTITVAKYQLTVSAVPQNRQYGVANAPFVATYATFQYNDTASVITGAPTFSTTAGPTSDPNVYSIVVTVGTLAATNYTFVAANSSITVTQATASITFTPFNPATYVYGGSPITPVTSSNSPVQIIYSIVSGHATVTGTGAGQAISINGIGTVVVAANQAANTDYTAAAQVTQSFNVTPAVITVTAQNVSITEGSAIPTLTATYTGFVYSDTQSVISGAPALSTTATSSSPTGTYPVTCGVGTLTATNYTFTCVNGTLTITGTTPQTITFPALGNITYGNTPPTLSATATPSGLAVTYTIASGPATLGVNNVLAITGIGKVCVTASQPGNGTYAAATPVTNCFTVSAATLTVTPTNLNINYGAAIPTLTYTITGEVNGDGPGVVSGAPNLSTTAVLNSPVGSYPINCAVGSLTAANYTFNCLTGTLTISADPQKITFNPLPGVTYGVAPITLGATTNSGLTITYTVTTPNTASVSGSVLTILGVGQVCVTASQAGNATTAAATPVTQCFTVSPAVLTVTAQNTTITFGSAIPTFTDQITGFQYNDTISVVSGSAKLTTTATSTSPGGTYPINCAVGSLTAANYTFTCVNGVLTIAADTQVITFAALPNIPQPVSPATSTSVTLTATASSGLPITYTLSPTSPATVNNTTGVLTVTNYGTVCVTATQPGNSSWLAATPVQQCFNVTATTATTAVSSTYTTYPGVSVTLTATITNQAKLGVTPTGTVSFYAFNGTTSSILLGPPATVSTTGTTTTAKLTSGNFPSGNLSISAVYSGDNNYSPSTSAAILVLIIAPDFTVTATPNIVTATASTPATSLLTLTPVGGYSNTVTFACSNLPKTLACTFAPPALNFYPGTGTGTLQQSTTVTITYSPQNGMLSAPDLPFLPRTQTAMAAVFLGLISWGIPLLSKRRRGLHKRLRHLTLLLLALGAFVGISGCGSGTPASTVGTYNIVVVMSDGTGLTHNQTLTVTTQ